MKIILFFVVIFQIQGTGMALMEENNKINIHGFLSQGFLVSTGNNFILDSKKGSFHFNELGINFTTQVADRLHVGIQFAARDFGDTGNDKVIIDWAFADYNWHDWLGLRLGKIKMPLGLYNKTRDIDMLRTFILLPQCVYSDSIRDTTTSLKGIGLYGVVSPGSLGNISYQASIGTTEIDLDGSTIKHFESFTGLNVTQCKVDRLLNGSLYWETPLNGLRAGFTFLNTKLVCSSTLIKDMVIPLNVPPYMLIIALKGDIFTIECPKYRINVFSLEYTRNNFVLAAEYLNMRKEIYINSIKFQNYLLWNSKSYYISGTYRLSEQFEFGINYTSCNTDMGGQIFPPPISPYLLYQKGLCVAARFDFNPHWTFKVEGHLLKGAALCFSQNNLNEAGIPVFARNWTLFGAKMSYTF
ncbi:MAG TPA: hypothetical protein VK469_20780 [Candidatus Kapabacteria bacterium]|nr:hypothetical protein [Candidatus Kapabacteria bacterium]